MFKSALFSLISIASIFVQANPLEAKLEIILNQNRAKVDSIQKQQLITQFDILSRMNKKDLTKEYYITQIQQKLSCRLSDVMIIANGVGEALPLLSVGVREINLRNVDNSLSEEITQILIEGRLSLKSLFGSGLDSIIGVSVETISSYDIEKIEAEIQKSFPGTALMALKLKGEKSFCGQQTLKLDMLNSLLK